MMGMNPKMMERMMRQMGIKQTAVPAEEVIIRAGEKQIRILDPQVILVEAQGQKTWQVSGKAVEETVKEQTFSEEDVKMVMEKTGKSMEEAEKALEESGGDIADAILKLS